MRKILILVSILLVFVMCYKNNDLAIPKDSIRFRVIAASDKEEDQILKENIVKDLKTTLIDIENPSRELTNQNIIAKIPEIKNIVDQYNVPYTVNYGMNYFPKKEFLDKSFNEGLYNSLVISLDEGLGTNFWCMLYPPLCFLDSKYEINNDIEYRFYVKEVLDKIIN